MSNDYKLNDGQSQQLKELVEEIQQLPITANSKNDVPCPAMDKLIDNASQTLLNPETIQSQNFINNLTLLNCDCNIEDTKCNMDLGCVNYLTLCEESAMSTSVQNINAHIKEALSNEYVGKISDGFHTFNELYEFRKMYNAHLFNEWYMLGRYDVHKSKLHHDGSVPFDNDEYFIVCATLPAGQISNHYKMKDWGLFTCQITERVKHPYDGHTSQDVIVRLHDAMKTRYKPATEKNESIKTVFLQELKYLMDDVELTRGKDEVDCIFTAIENKNDYFSILSNNSVLDIKTKDHRMHIPDCLYGTTVACLLLSLSTKMNNFKIDDKWLHLQRIGKACTFIEFDFPNCIKVTFSNMDIKDSVTYQIPFPIGIAVY